MNPFVRRALHRVAGRARRDLSPQAWEIVAALGARVRDGPALLPGPPPGPVLVIAPHPDDETIGCGGALARHAAAGDAVTVLVATSGEATAGGGADAAGAREAECRAACAALGLTAEPVFLRLPDGRLGEHTAALAGAIRHHGADAAAVYAPALTDPHRDHRAVNAALAGAGLDADVYGYEVWAAAPVAVLLDVTATYAQKEAALACYRTALQTVDYVRSARGLAAFRSAGGGLGGSGYAEGFTRLAAAEHSVLAAGG